MASHPQNRDDDDDDGGGKQPVRRAAAPGVDDDGSQSGEESGRRSGRWSSGSAGSSGSSFEGSRSGNPAWADMGYVQPMPPQPPRSQRIDTFLFHLPAPPGFTVAYDVTITKKVDNPANLGTGWFLMVNDAWLERNADALAANVVSALTEIGEVDYILFGQFLDLSTEARAAATVRMLVVKQLVHVFVKFVTPPPAAPAAPAAAGGRGRLQRTTRDKNLKNNPNRPNPGGPKGN